MIETISFIARRHRSSAWVAFTAAWLGPLAAHAQAGAPAALPAPSADAPAAAPSTMTPPTSTAPTSGPAASATAPTGDASAPAPEVTTAPPAKPKPPPYSLPWQLRGAAPANVVRSDTAIAFYQNAAGNSGSTVASLLFASYKVTPEIAPLIRLGFEHDGPPSPGNPGTALLNPLLGATWGIKPSPETRFAAFLGFTLPVGGGGGDTPDAATAASLGKGAAARSYFDNALFAVNYLAIIPGLDFAFVSSGFTAQAEVTLFELVRTRGDALPANADSSRTNLTTGLHLGYFLIPELSLGADLRYQRWLKNSAIPDDVAARDNATFAIGPRAHFLLSDGVWLRPGIAYARGIDNPLSDLKYNIVQIDVPVVF